MKRESGFTVYELMICITILIILASLLLPTYGKATKSAKATVCTSNLKQIYYALKLYESDYGEYPPNSVVWPAFKTYYPTVLKCPESRDPEMPEYDYTIYVSASKPYDQLLNDCRSKRGLDIPLAWDMNHSPRLVSPDSSGFYLLIRENGSVDRRFTKEIFKEGFDYTTLPCTTPIPIELSF